MSRSYKHTPRCGEQKSKFAKRWANGRVRCYPPDEGKRAFPQHNGYKKIFCSWAICDYEEVGVTFEQFYAREVRMCRVWQNPIPTRAEARKEYRKRYIRK